VERQLIFAAIGLIFFLSASRGSVAPRTPVPTVAGGMATGLS
jgi:hypothetical protein